MAPDVLAQAVALRRRGWTYQRIADHLHYSRWHLRTQVMAVLGVTRPSKWERPRVAALMREDGIPLARIATALGYPSTIAASKAIYQCRKTRGLRLLVPGRGRKGKGK